MLPLVTLVALAPLLTASPADGLAWLDEGARIAGTVGDTSERADLLLRAAECAAPVDPARATAWLLEGLSALATESPEARAGISRTLVALGSEPLDPALAPGDWRAVARDRALRALFRRDPEAGMALADRIGLPDVERIRLLAEAARAGAGAGAFAPAVLAQLALERALRQRPLDESLLRIAVGAVLDADPRAGNALLVEAGPVRSVAALLLVERAETPEAVVVAAESLPDPVRRAGALLARARAADPAGRAILAEAAREAAARIPQPADRAVALAEAAALLAPETPPQTVGELARATALSEPDDARRREALAAVGATLAPTAPQLARSCVEEALAQARAVRSEGERTRALRGIGTRIGPRYAEEATRIVKELGSGRAASQVEVLVAMAGSAEPTERATALRLLAAAVRGWDVGPADKLRALEGLALPEEADAEGDVSKAEREVRDLIGQLLLERAARAESRSTRIAGYTAAAEWLERHDAGAARKAYESAIAEIDAANGETGWIEVLLTRVGRLSPERALDLARRMKQPANAVRALLACGATEEAAGAAARTKDDWLAAELLSRCAIAAPSQAALEALREAIDALPLEGRRDALLGRAIAGLLRTGTERAWDAALELAPLTATPTGLAQTRLEVARYLLREGDEPGARQRVTEAEELIASAGRPDECLVALAPLTLLLGGDGLAVAESVRARPARARALIELAAVALESTD